MTTATTHRYDTSKYRAPPELRLPADRVETDPELRVVIFDSADPDYYISHLDVKRLREVPDRPGAANLADTWYDFVTRLAHAPVPSIASIRGRSRGIGNEFTLACDRRAGRPRDPGRR